MNLQNITQQYLDIFPGDLSGSLQQRQTPNVLYSTVKPVGFARPKLILFNEELSQQTGLGKFDDEDLPFLAATDLPANVRTYATAYAGHQFGNWAGQLGDGRAIYAGEIKDEKGRTTELQWKGAGATPYSRSADGRAVLRSSLREYLMSEAMWYLGVPTTRSLSIVLTGEQVIRDMMYDGNPQPEPGAVVIRTAESFLRFGHFELLSAQKDIALLTELTDFAIANYFPEIRTEGSLKYRDFFASVCRKTAALMSEWFRVGFVHGVMNTDNMSLLGLTIDYGPFSMLDSYDLNFTPNTTDLPGRRYAFGKQAQISQWNLWQLANALFPLIEDADFLEKTLNEYSDHFWQQHDCMMASKFGFENLTEKDDEFFTEWQKLMTDLQLDYTLFFTELEKWDESAGIKDFFEKVSYSVTTDESLSKLNDFLISYIERRNLNNITIAESRMLMAKSNPRFILRNYLLFECIEEVKRGEKSMLNKLLHALQNPYQEIYPEFSVKRPLGYDDVSGCSMLSCSS